MLVVERRQKIIEVINEKKSVRVSELSKLFSVTEETIRRDLEKLEAEQKLTRSHGGAVSVQMSDAEELPFEKREITNIAEKSEIARLAVEQVEEGDTIVLDASSTAWYMAKTLPDMKLTVVTNSLKVAMELSAKKLITVISTGGTLLDGSLSFVGPLATSSLDTYYVNKAFISCKGFHFERGLSESDERQALVKKKMMDIAHTVYIMLDHTKFDVQAFSKLGEIQDANHLIIDKKLDLANRKRLQDQGLCLISSE